MNLPLELQIECFKYLEFQKVVMIDTKLAILTASKESWYEAIKTQSDMCLSFLHLNKIPSPCSGCLLESAIQIGNVSILKYLLNNNLVQLTENTFKQTGNTKNGLEMTQLFVNWAPQVFAKLLGLDTTRIKSISIEIVQEQDYEELDGNDYFDFGGFQLYANGLEFRDDFSDTESDFDLSDKEEFW